MLSKIWLLEPGERRRAWYNAAGFAEAMVVVVSEGGEGGGV